MKSIKALAYYGVSAIEMLVHFRQVHRLVPLFLSRNISGSQVLRFRNRPLQFIVRSAMDVWSIKETFIDAFYTRYGTSIEDGWRVIDIGAGIGDFSIFAAHIRPDAVVYAYEPFPESHRLLIENLSLNGIKNVHSFQQAVWSREDQLSLDVSSGEPLQIASQASTSTHQDDDLLNVQAISLEQILGNHHLERVDLLKLDCEGAEYQILMCAPGSVLLKVDRIIMEYHDLDDERNHRKLVSFLQAMDFSVTTNANFVHENIGYLYATRF